MDSTGQLSGAEGSGQPPIDKEKEALLYRKFWHGNLKYDEANRMLRLALDAGALIIVLLVLAIYFTISSGRPLDRYYIANETGTVGALQALERPNESKDALADWVSSSIIQVMTFSFNDIDQRFDISSKLFTEKGWNDFRDVMIKSGFVKNVMSNKLMITSAPSSDPLLIQDGIIEGGFQWVFTMKILITYRSGGVQRNENRTVTVYVEKIPTSVNSTGIGISQFMLY